MIGLSIKSPYPVLLVLNQNLVNLVFAQLHASRAINKISRARLKRIVYCQAAAEHSKVNNIILHGQHMVTAKTNFFYLVRKIWSFGILRLIVVSSFLYFSLMTDSVLPNHSAHATWPPK